MASGATAFAFGKYRGRTFQDVAESQPGYCEWALKIESPTGAMKDFVDFLKERGKGGQAHGPRMVGRAGPASPGPSLEGARLPPETTLVCELVGESRFMVRAEALGGISARPGAGGGFVGARRLPAQLWAALGGMSGATLSADGQGWLYPLASYDAVARSLEALGSVERIPPWVFAWTDRSRRSRAAEPMPERHLPAEMMPYQLEGLNFGWSRGGRCLIGDEMGLGKTLQALAIAAQFTEDWPVLVVCPSSLCWVWKEQATQWLPELLGPENVQVVRKAADKLSASAKMYVISYNLLGHGAKKGSFQERPDGSPHGVVICDESHCIKEWKAARTKVVVPLLQKARRVMLLSGTPTRNSADELHPQLCGLIPGLPAKYAEFRARYCLQQSSNVGGGRFVNKIVGVRNAMELNHVLTSTVMVRRLKKEVLTQLPDKRRQRIPIQVPDKILEDLSDGFVVGSDGIVNAFVTGDAPKVFMKMSKAKLPGVKEYLEEVLERADEKFIVFAHHKHVMDELSELFAKKLGKDGLSHIRIDGNTPNSKRPELVKRFQEDEACRVALLSITACAEGITMTAAGLVIFAELYWVPGAVEQAEARAHRLGTTHTKVVVEFLVVPNSPDEMIYKSLDRKKKDTSHVLNGAIESMNMSEVAFQRREPRKRPAEEAESVPAKRHSPLAKLFGSSPPSGAKKGKAASTAEAATATPASSAASSFSDTVTPPSADAKAASPTAAASGEKPRSSQAQMKVDFLLRAARAGAAEFVPSTPL